MPEHWVTVVAAVLGLLGGMGGAAVGGYTPLSVGAATRVVGRCDD